MRHVEHVMGTVVSLDVRGPVPAGALERAVASLHEADRLFSTYRADSAVARLERGEVELGDCPAEVAEVLAACRVWNAVSAGAFDAWASGRLDPSGLVKGWAVQRASDLLHAAGCTVTSVNGGGDVVVRGTREDRPWRTGVADPLRRGQLLAVVEGTDLAVATSGATERGGHVLDPRTGRAADGLAGVTVVAPELVQADVCATAATVLGADALSWLEAQPGVEALVVDPRGRVSVTSGWAVRARPAPAAPRPAPRPVRLPAGALRT